MALGDLLARFTVAPARLLRLAKGTLCPGADADVTVFDPDCQWVFRADQSSSKSRNTPFDGWTLRGKTVATIVAGNIIWCDREAAATV
jgi:dihydroorotase